MEELNARIDEAEEQIARGEVIDADEADREIEKMFALWAWRSLWLSAPKENVF